MNMFSRYLDDYNEYKIEQLESGQEEYERAMKYLDTLGIARVDEGQTLTLVGRIMHLRHGIKIQTRS
jgi:hypothetical protein